MNLKSPDSAVRLNKYDNPPMPIIQSLKPLVEMAVEKKSATEFDGPGQYAYKKISMAIDQTGGTTMSKRVIISCPFCNKIQFLAKNEFTYELDTDLPKITRLKAKINVWWDRIWNKEPFKLKIPGLLTVEGEITCDFNKMHHFTVIRNKIEMPPIQKNVVSGPA
jgi:hypothetical protein